MESEIQKRIFGYDLIKALAIFLVVLYHFKSVDFGIVPESGWYIPNVTKFLYAFCSSGVPLFFMVNGALTSAKEITFQRSLKKSGRLFFVTVFWTVFFLCILYPFVMGKKMPNISEFQNYYWFLYSLIGLYWINYLLNKFKFLKKICVVVLFVFPFVTNFIWTLVLFYSPSLNLPGWGHTGVFTMYSIVYYYLGFFLARKDLPLYVSLILIILGLLLVNAEVVVMSTYYQNVYDGVNSSFPTIGAMLLSVGLFSLVKSVKGESNLLLKKFLSVIGRNTIGIYIFHLFFVLLVKKNVFVNEVQNPIVVVFFAFVVLVVATIITKLINRTWLNILLKL